MDKLSIRRFNMKTVFTLLCFTLLPLSIIAQQASDYFPAETGFVWNYRVAPLDPNNNEIDTLVYARQDTFALVSNYKNKLANIVLSKSGFSQTLPPIQLYTDTLYFNFDGTDAYEYFSTGSLEVLMAQLDSAQIASSFSFINFIRSLQNWYPVYKFGSNINSEYTLLSKDTTININGTDFKIRFEYLGTRLNDENISTGAGIFNCKKFLSEWKVSYVSIIGPFKILSTEDTIWIAPGNWIVKDIIPTNNIDLTVFQLGQISIPGLKTELQAITDVKPDVINPHTIYLSQNYPNPFNPITKIRYTIPDAVKSHNELVKLKVYDILGNEVVTLVNEEKPAGSYEVEFSGENLTSGVYFYKLQAGSYVETKKMVLLK